MPSEHDGRPSTSDAGKLAAPKRIIRSQCGYNARTHKELSFEKGEFFHVVDYENDPSWYCACNPLTGKRGLVPVSHFEIMESRQERIRRIQRSSSSLSIVQEADSTAASAATMDSTSIRTSLGIQHGAPNGILIHPSSRKNSSSFSMQRRPSEGGATLVEPMAIRSRSASIQGKQIQQQQQQHQRKLSIQQSGHGVGASVQPLPMQLYGTVLYDFEAESSDELAIRADEPVLVVAQSTADWFVAKPAMRAAEPGLVPVSYISLRDHVTGGPVDDLQAYLCRYHIRLPSVAEWKKKSLASRSRSTHSTSSTNSDATTTGNSGSNQATERSSSPANSTAEDRIPTPVSSLGSLKSSQAAALNSKPRTRARTASSSTSSIAERSSFRPFHKGRQASVSSLQHLSSDNFPPFHPSELLSVGVPSFICKDGAYLFLVSLKFKSGDERNLYRGYDDFIHFQIQLSDCFPEATAPLKSSRFLANNSSGMGYLNDSIAERRRNDIEDYIQNLLALPQNVIASPVFQSLFGSSVGLQQQQKQQPLYRSLSAKLLSELPPPPPPPLPAQYTSTSSVESAVSASITPVSTASSRTMVDESLLHADAIGNNGAMSMPKVIEGGVLNSSSTSTKELVLEPVRSSPKLVHKPSTLALAGGISMVKVKLKLGSDMIALRLPSTVSVNELKSKIAERLENEDFAMSRDEISKIMYFAPSGEFTPLSADDDWRTALEVTNNKPVLTIVQ
ncbi:bud emergence protein 1 [Dipsacomyces acuminosporus]|nr:bud emergence protein 1 [Dipsacomyces acuminosporus]